METAEMRAIDIKLVIALVVWLAVLMLVASAADVVASPESVGVKSCIGSEQAELVQLEE